MKKIQIAFLGILLFATIACGEDKTGVGDAGYNSLVKMMQVGEEDSHCEHGGIQIDTGLDTNRNGMLEEWEIEWTEVLCAANPSGEPGQDGQDGFPTLFSSAPEAPGDNCPHGGIALHWGVDLNGDGDLTVQEVTDTDYLCHGEPGKTSLVEIHQEDAGIHCVDGGLRILTGVDQDGDGLLGLAEVASTAYLCNAKAGESSLVRLDEEPAGTNCARGGVRVQSGLDTDGSGALEDPEVRYTQYVCNP